MKHLQAAYILVAVLAVQASSLSAGFSVNWWTELSSDGSTNYIPLAVDSADNANTLTLTDWVNSPFFSGSGWVSFKRHSPSGSLLFHKNFFPLGTPAPGIQSRRDLVLEPASGHFWMVVNEEAAPRWSHFYVADAAGSVVSDWRDAIQSREVVDLAVGSNGAVFAAGTGGLSGEFVVDKYSAPGTLAWSYTLATGIPWAHDCGVVATGDGGAFAVVASDQAKTMQMIRLDAAGNLLWKAQAPVAGWMETLDAVMDPAGNAYIASGVLVSGLLQCQLIKVDPSGNVSQIAQWSADAAGSSLHTLLRLADGSFMVGGQAGLRPYVAELSAAGALQGEWNGGAAAGGEYHTLVRALGLRSDGGIYATAIVAVPGPLYYNIAFHGLLLSLSRTAVSDNNIPGFGPTPSPTATMVPTALATATMVPTPLPSAGPTTEATAAPTGGPTELPTLLPTPLPTSLPTSVPTFVPTAMPTELPTAEPTALPTTEITATPTNTLTAMPSETPWVATLTPTPTVVRPVPTKTSVSLHCPPVVMALQLVPCPLVDPAHSSLKVELGPCVPTTLQITVYTASSVLIASRELHEAELNAGWNTLQLPSGNYGIGLLYFKVVARRDGMSSEMASSCMVLN